jgi:hypothetical protein
MKPALYLMAAVGFFALITPADAGDVKLLKQPSAFPLVINQPGSYRLKSNITVPDATTTAISITADNVTLDLNGYSIRGPTVCAGTPVTSCSPTGTGVGIDSSYKANIAIVNGTVQGMGNSGLALLGVGSRVEKVRAVSNGNRGIDVGNTSTVTGCIALGNGGTGILTGGISVVTANVAAGNAGSGVGAQGAGTGVVMANTAERNGGDGFEGGSAFIGNTAEFNGAYGLSTSVSQFGYANNVLFINTFGSVGGGGTEMGHNDCNGSTTCP